MTRLKKPFRIEMRKSSVIANYRVHYIGVRLILYVITQLSFQISYCYASLSTLNQTKFTFARRAAEMIGMHPVKLYHAANK